MSGYYGLAKVIRPVTSKVKVFYSPGDKEPIIDEKTAEELTFTKRENYTAVERYTMAKGDKSLSLAGFIKSDLNIELESNEKIEFIAPNAPNPFLYGYDMDFVKYPPTNPNFDENGWWNNFNPFDPNHPYYRSPNKPFIVFELLNPSKMSYPDNIFYAPTNPRYNPNKPFDAMNLLDSNHPYFYAENYNNPKEQPDPKKQFDPHYGEPFDLTLHPFAPKETKQKIKYSYIDNIIMFDEAFGGGEKIQISYKTDILEATLPPSPWAKELDIKISHYERAIKHTHKWEYRGYYEYPRGIVINLGEVYSLDVGDLEGASVLWFRLGELWYDITQMWELRPVQDDIRLPKSCDSFGDVKIERTLEQPYPYGDGAYNDDWEVNYKDNLLDVLYFQAVLKNGKKLPLKKLVMHPLKLEVSEVELDDINGRKNIWERAGLESKKD